MPSKTCSQVGKSIWKNNNFIFRLLLWQNRKRLKQDDFLWSLEYFCIPILKSENQSRNHSEKISKGADLTSLAWLIHALAFWAWSAQVCNAFVEVLALCRDSLSRHLIVLQDTLPDYCINNTKEGKQSNLIWRRVCATSFLIVTGYSIGSIYCITCNFYITIDIQ